MAALVTAIALVKGSRPQAPRRANALTEARSRFGRREDDLTVRKSIFRSLGPFEKRNKSKENFSRFSDLTRHTEKADNRTKCYVAKQPLLQ